MFQWFKIVLGEKTKMEMTAVAPFSERPAKGSRDRAIDLVHLSRMTFGDRALEREVLALFARQSAQMLAKIDGADADGLRILAHTLKGSASGVGAWMVASAASDVEKSAGHKDTLGPAIARLRSTVDEACGLAESLLRSH
jgi:HPt (histidine-containing phosphotransfer) domain-containing protein